MGLSLLAAGIALLASAAAPPPALRPLAPDAPGAASAPILPALQLTAPSQLAVAGYLPPACSAEVCQPRVALPGREPSFQPRGRRTELALLMAQRSGLGPVVTIARLLARTGLRVEYSPLSLDASRRLDRGARGELLVGVRWRLDAANRPLWAAPPAR